MVQCSIACCTSTFRQTHNGNKMKIFIVPYKRTKTCMGEDSPYGNSVNNAINRQHEAWMLTINRGCNDETTKISNDKNTRICIKHFHSSVVLYDASRIAEKSFSQLLTKLQNLLFLFLEQGIIRIILC